MIWCTVWHVAHLSNQGLSGRRYKETCNGKVCPCRNFFSFQVHTSKHESLFILKVTMHFLMVHVESWAFQFILHSVFSFYFECQHFSKMFIPELYWMHFMFWIKQNKQNILLIKLNKNQNNRSKFLHKYLDFDCDLSIAAFIAFYKDLNTNPNSCTLWDSRYLNLGLSYVILVLIHSLKFNCSADLPHLKVCIYCK